MTKDDYKAILEEAKRRKPDLSADEARQILANYEAKTGQAGSEPAKSGNVLESIYNLAIKPTIEGAKGFGELVGAAGLTVGSMATEKLAPELSLKMADKALDIRQQTGMEGSFDQGTMSGLKTVGVGTLKGLGGVGAAVDLYTMGTAGSLTGATRQLAKEGVRNLLVNSGLYGSGEALGANRQGEDVLEAFMRGATGQGTTGIFEGLTGDSEIAKAADVALSVGLPILLGKQIDRATNKIVSIGNDAATSAVSMVKRGIGTEEVAGNLKQKIGDAAYEQFINNLEAEMKTTQTMRLAAKRKGIRLGEEAYARGITGNWSQDVKLVVKQNKQTKDALGELVANYQSSEPLVTKSDLEGLTERLKQGQDKRTQRVLDRWFEDLPQHNLKTMDDIYKLKQLAGKEAFRQFGNARDTARAEAYRELFFDLRDIVTKRVEGSDKLMKHLDAGILLEQALKRSEVALRPKDLERQIRQVLSPGGAAQYLVGKTVEKIVSPLVKYAGESRLQQSPSQLRMTALKDALGQGGAGQ